MLIAVFCDCAVAYETFIIMHKTYDLFSLFLMNNIKQAAH